MDLNGYGNIKLTLSQLINHWGKNAVGLLAIRSEEGSVS